MEWRAGLDISGRKELNLFPYVQPRFLKQAIFNIFFSYFVHKVFSTSTLAKFPLSFPVFWSIFSHHCFSLQCLLHVARGFVQLTITRKTSVFKPNFIPFFNLSSLKTMTLFFLTWCVFRLPWNRYWDSVVCHI